MARQLRLAELREFESNEVWQQLSAMLKGSVLFTLREVATPQEHPMLTHVLQGKIAGLEMANQFLEHLIQEATTVEEDTIKQGEL